MDTLPQQTASAATGRLSHELRLDRLAELAVRVGLGLPPARNW